jgi:hypothetical protein
MTKLAIVTAVGFAAVILLASQFQAPQATLTPKFFEQNSTLSFASIKSCFGLEWQDQTACLDEFNSLYGQDKSIKAILGELEADRHSDKEIENMCHQITHSVGRFALLKHGTVGDAFEACDFTCSSGCLHGVVERLFFSGTNSGKQHVGLKDIQTIVPQLCAPTDFKQPTPQIIYQCAHGVGHALLFSLDYNLQDSLAACDLFDQMRQISCYTGVFMENITAHDQTKRQLKPSDSHYPCNSVAEKYRDGCYFMQTSAMQVMGKSPLQIAAECKNAGNYRLTCFRSLGRDESNNYLIGQTKQVVVTCESQSGDDLQSCVSGVALALIDYQRDASLSYQFCNQLRSPDMCYRVVNEYLLYSFGKTKLEITQYCNEFGITGKEICLANVARL